MSKSNIPDGWVQDCSLKSWESGQAWLYLIKRSAADSDRFVCKVLKNVTNPERRQRFLTEVEVTKTLFRLGCGVAEISQSGNTPSDRPYLITPYFPSGDLRKYSANHPFTGDLKRTVVFLRQLHGLLLRVHTVAAHRDLKPDNILVHDSGSPVLCDFGLCLLLWDEGDKDRNTDALMQIGSRHYIAPEALSGFPSVANTLALDAYSFGKICYELAAGQPLPGLLLPTDNWDLTNRFIHRDAAYLFNKTVQGLVMHDPEIRMTTWNRLSALFDQVESLCAPTSENPLTGKDLGLTLSRLLDSNSTARLAKQKRDFYSAREDYSNRLATAISEALDENEGARALIQLSQQNDKIEFSLARRSDEAILKLAEFSLEDGELRDGQSWPGMRARLRIGADPIEDLLPTLTADVVWKDDFKRFKLSIVVYLCRFGTGSSGGMFVAVPPNPKYYHLEWTSIGDDAYLAQARIAATAAAHDFFDMLQALLTPGAA